MPRTKNPNISGRSLTERRSPGSSKRKSTEYDDDDDDFVNPPKSKESTEQSNKKQKSKNVEVGESSKSEGPETRGRKQKSSKAIVIVEDPEIVSHNSKDEDVKKMQFRCSPRFLHDALAELNDSQKESVKAMGFGSILQCKIREIPTDIARWCVSCYNGRSASLDLMKGKCLEINEEDVFLTLGLPKGEISMTRNPRLAGSTLGEQWENRLGRPDKRVRQGDVIKSMLSKKHGGDWFKLNFLVVIEASLIEAPSDGNVRPKILDNLHDLRNVHRLKWCKYLLETLILCHQKYIKQVNGIFNGPLLFLVLFYVDRVANITMQIDRVFPALKGWTSELLKNRQSRELQYGGFGDGRLQNPMEPNNEEDRIVCFGQSNAGVQHTQKQVDAATYLKKVITNACEVSRVMTEFVESLIDVPKELLDNLEVCTKVNSTRNLLKISEPRSDNFGPQFFDSTKDKWKDAMWSKYCSDVCVLFESVDKVKKVWDLKEGSEKNQLNAECSVKLHNVEEDNDQNKIEEMVDTEKNEDKTAEMMETEKGEENTPEMACYSFTQFDSDYGF